LSRTLVVAPVGDGSDAASNGVELLEALSFLGSGSLPPGPTNPWLIKLEPGIYNVGTTVVSMLSYVDIEGSGLMTTRITGSQTGCPGVVILAGNSELRFLSIENSANDAALVTRGVTVEGTTGQISHVPIISEGQHGQGLVILSSREATVRDSILIGSTVSLAVVGTGNIVSTQLDGPVGSAGVFRCVGTYDENFTALSATCNWSNIRRLIDEVISGLR